ncbi:MAG: tetratricopeptide repeat protein [Bacteroidota bacterium]|nr:tetratricopeptide repeat protein [Bacteroidota bacterium]MDP3146109.1 tetratricopeptide repeat protein [Bacteroidota bacterium]
MQTKIKYIIIIIFGWICNFYCQNSDNNFSIIEDSVLKSIAIKKPDTTIARSYNYLAFELRRNNPTKSVKYGELALVIYTKNNNLGGVALSNFNLGTAHLNLSKHHDALEYFNKAIFFGNKAGDKKVVAAAYNNIGIVFIKQGNTSEAIKNYLLGLKLRAELNDKSQMGASYANIGNVYFNERKYDEALKNYKLAVNLFEETNTKFGLANAISNIGNLYLELGKIDTAYNFFNKSLKISLEINDKRGISSSYNHLGSIYLIQKKYTLAKDYFNRALKMQEETENIEGMVGTINDIGRVEIELNNISSAEKKLKENLIILKKTRSLKILADCYALLSRIDTLKRDYKNSFYHYKLHVEYMDSVRNKDNSEKIIQQQLTFDFNKKEAETKEKQLKKDIVAKEELRQQKKITNISIGAGVLVFLFLVIAIRAYNGKQKANLITLQQKIEVEKQKHLVDEKQKEIIDSITYAKRLQEAILPPFEFINKHFKHNFILYKPKDLVAGDFYWSEKIGDKFYIAAADSTGHGVPGALVSIVCSNALHRTVKEFNISETGKILDKTRELVLETFEKSTSDVKDGMDISLLCIDNKNKKIFWSGANNPLWYISHSSNSNKVGGNELMVIKADKQPIGKTDNPKPFTTHEIDYIENTTFYLFTDGFADQFGGPSGKKFNKKQFSELLIKNNQLTLHEQKDCINEVFENWKGNLGQVDDVCLIGIKI